MKGKSLRRYQTLTAEEWADIEERRARGETWLAISDLYKINSGTLGLAYNARFADGTDVPTTDVPTPQVDGPVTRVPSSLTEEDWADIDARRARGETWPTISAAYQMNRGSLHGAHVARLAGETDAPTADAPTRQGDGPSTRAPSSLTDEEWNEILTLEAEGETLVSIAVAYGINRHTLYDAIRKRKAAMGITTTEIPPADDMPVKRVPSSLTAEEWADIDSREAAGESLDTLAADYNLNRHTLYGALNKHRGDKAIQANDVPPPADNTPVLTAVKELTQRVTQIATQVDAMEQTAERDAATQRVPISTWIAAGIAAASLAVNVWLTSHHVQHEQPAPVVQEATTEEPPAIVVDNDDE